MTVNLKKYWILSTWITLSVPAVFIGCGTSTTTDSRDKSSDTDSAVTVSGTTTDSSPTDFKQAGESVQVGGVNLMDSSSETVEVWRVDPTGVRTLVTAVPVVSKSFKVTISGDAYYQFVSTTSHLSSVLGPWYTGSGTSAANLTLDRSTTVASKMLEIIADSSKKGDKVAASVLANRILSSSDLVSLGASVAMVASTSRSSTDLSAMVQSLVTQTVEKVKQTNIALPDYAKSLSISQQLVLFSSSLKDVKPAVAAMRTATPNDNFDIARKVTADYSEKFSEVAPEAACIALQQNYRAGKSASDVDSAATTAKIGSDYQTLSTQPKSTLHDTVVSQPPIAPTPFPTSTTGGAPTQSASGSSSTSPTASSSGSSSSTPTPTPTSS